MSNKTHSPAKKYPSMAGRRVLLDISTGRSCAGHSGTVSALQRAGLIDDAGELTDTGLQMLARLTGKPMEARHGGA